MTEICVVFVFTEYICASHDFSSMQGNETFPFFTVRQATENKKPFERERNPKSFMLSICARIFLPSSFARQQKNLCTPRVISLEVVYQESDTINMTAQLAEC